MVRGFQAPGGRDESLQVFESGRGCVCSAFASPDIKWTRRGCHPSERCRAIPRRPRQHCAGRLVLVVVLLTLGARPGAAQPDNDNFVDASILMESSGSITGDNVDAGKEAGEPNHAGDPGGASVWWRWTASDTGIMICDTLGSDIDTLLAVYVGDRVESLTLIASNDDVGDEFQSLLGFPAIAGTTYHLAVDGFDGDQGRIVLNWEPRQSSDQFNDAITLTGTSGETHGANIGATKEAGEPDHADEPGGSSVWWQWTAPENGLVTFDTLGSIFDTLLAVYTGDDVGGLTMISSNDDFEDELQSVVTFTAVAGTAYHVAVDGYDGETGLIRLNWMMTPAGEPVVGGVTRLPDGRLVLEWVGRPGTRYAVESTGDFINWAPQGTIDNTTGAATFTTPQSSARQQFFRVRLVEQ
jgi:hypothetical protein